MLASRLPEAVLVVAHPDDEILWFSSIVDKVDRIIISYLDVPENAKWTQGRRRAASAYPLPNATFLGLSEAPAYAGADWLGWPVTTDSGLELNKNEKVPPGFSPARYESNYRELVLRLRECLRDVSTVITHNPWGEYGHEEHVQVYRAVMSVQAELGFDVWYTNYCSDRSYRLMLRETHFGFRTDLESLPTNAKLAHAIEAVYRREDCWTWPYDDYIYFPYETFIRHDTSRGGNSHPASAIPLNFVRVERLPRPPAPPVSPIRRAARAVKRRVARPRPR
jgi:LmbE family N-acetylglucosaminyl deacetylase